MRASADVDAARRASLKPGPGRKRATYPVGIASHRVCQKDSTPDAAKRYAAKYRSRNGHAKRFLLDRLRRAAGQPMTTLDLTHEWMAERGIPNHHATYVIIRRRIGASIMHLMRHGLVRVIETGKWRKEYVIAGEA